MKSLRECLQTLILTAGGNGNLLFNVGPMPDGRIEPRQVARLKEMGAWLNQYGETIYRTRGGPWKPTKAIASTRRGNTIFVHVLHWDGDVVTLQNIPRKIRAHSVMTGGEAKVTQTQDRVEISVAEQYRQPIDTIVRLDLDGPAMNLESASVK